MVERKIILDCNWKDFNATNKAIREAKDVLSRASPVFLNEICPKAEKDVYKAVELLRNALVKLDEAQYHKSKAQKQRGW